MNDPIMEEARQAGEPLAEVGHHLPDAPVAPAHGIAAMALSMAIKYHDMNMVHDGVLYQQYKMDGRNLKSLHLSDVFETAIAMEKHLIASEQRIAAIIVEALEVGIADSEDAVEGLNEPAVDESSDTEGPSDQAGDVCDH